MEEMMFHLDTESFLDQASWWSICCWSGRQRIFAETVETCARISFSFLETIDEGVATSSTFTSSEPHSKVGYCEGQLERWWYCHSRNADVLRGEWPLRRVVQVHPGGDNCVRVVRSKWSPGFTQGQFWNYALYRCWVIINHECWCCLIKNGYAQQKPP